MCGIIGCFGSSKAKQNILDALEVLEYRGYDSAGVSIWHQGAYKRYRVKGRLQKLKAQLQDKKFDGCIGIGHTRWATHGEPSANNAHPHCVGGVHIVHNGIVENHNELRGRFAGVESQTDSELIAHLVHHFIQQGQNLLQAGLSAQAELKGSFAVVVLSDEHPDQMLAFKKGPPLLMAERPTGASGCRPPHSTNELMPVLVASDVQAVLQHSKHIRYLEDGDVLHIQKSGFVFYDADGHEVQRPCVQVPWSVQGGEKQGYAHFMLKEIFENPQAVAHAIAPYLNAQKNKVRIEAVESLGPVWRDCEQISIVACGTSFYAGCVARYWFEQMAGFRATVEVASEFRYRDPVLGSKTLVLVISQSGETADTLAALRLAHSRGVGVVALCNVPGSSLDREADACLYMHAGPEVGVASTKAFLSSLSVLYLLVLLRVQHNSSVSVGSICDDLLHSLLQIPSQIEALLGGDDLFSVVAQDLIHYRGFLYMGRSVHYPIALEGALKLKELAYKHAEGYAAGEMKHGPLALVDDKMLVVALIPDDLVFEKTLNNLEEVRARGGEVIAITSGSADTLSHKRLKSLSQHVLQLPTTHSSLYPLLEVVPLQLLAYHVACALGHDVDRPRNLAKSVTVE